VHYEHLLQTLSFSAYIILFLVVFLENVGLPIPGLTIALVMAAISTTGQFNFWLVVAITVLSGTAGGAIGYWIGLKGGRKLLLKYGKYVLITPSRFAQAETAFQKHGTKAVYVRCYIPFICVWGCNLAGIAKIPARRFMFANIGGMLLWSTTNLTLGFFLGRSFEVILKVLNGAIVAVAVVAIVGAVFYYKHRRKASAIRQKKLALYQKQLEVIPVPVEEQEIYN
jgi:membrane protein DedA with SNARE-associated domain